MVLADGFKDAVKELTDGRGVDIVVDPVGGDRFTDSLRSLAPGGRLLVIGFTGGEIPTVKVNRLLLNNVDAVGVGWGAWTLTHPGLPAPSSGPSSSRCWRRARCRRRNPRCIRWSGRPTRSPSLEDRTRQGQGRRRGCGESAGARRRRRLRERSLPREVLSIFRAVMNVRHPVTRQLVLGKLT